MPIFDLWQLVGKSNVGYMERRLRVALHILVASHTCARKDFDPQPKLVGYYIIDLERMKGLVGLSKCE